MFDFSCLTSISRPKESLKGQRREGGGPRSFKLNLHFVTTNKAIKNMDFFGELKTL